MHHVYLVSDEPLGVVSKTVAMPNGTMVHVLDRAVFDRAVKAAMAYEPCDCDDVCLDESNCPVRGKHRAVAAS